MVLGHGIQSAEGGTDLTLDTLALEDNAIVGLLLDGEGTSVTANEVHVDVARIWDDCDASLAQCFGAHSQNGAPDVASIAGISVGTAAAGTPQGALKRTDSQLVQAVEGLVGWVPQVGWVPVAVGIGGGDGDASADGSAAAGGAA